MTDHTEVDEREAQEAFDIAHGEALRMKRRYHACRVCGQPDAPEQFSFGIHAGYYCDGECWRKSGYRDAVDPDARFDPMDAGECLEPEDY